MQSGDGTAKERFLLAIQAAGMTPVEAARRYGMTSNYFQRNPFPVKIEVAQWLSVVSGYRASWLLFGELPARADTPVDEAMGSAYRLGRATAFRAAAEMLLQAAQEPERPSGRGGAIPEPVAGTPLGGLEGLARAAAALTAPAGTPGAPPAPSPEALTVPTRARRTRSA